LAPRRHASADDDRGYDTKDERRQPLLPPMGERGESQILRGLVKKIEGRFEQLPLDGITKYGVEQKVVTATSFVTVRPSIQRSLWQSQGLEYPAARFSLMSGLYHILRNHAAGMTSKVTS
jgi:hypothetical protein